MKAPDVDLVLVIDSSDSMGPCIDGLRRHLRELIKPMQGHIGKIRFGLVSLSASKQGGSVTYRVSTLAGEFESVRALYSGAANQYGFFSDDPDEVIDALDGIEVTGNEDNLVALDCALDHPFGPTSSTKRVVALFADEPLEAGVEGRKGVAKLRELINKVHARRVKLFCALPYSDAAQLLSEADGSEIEAIDGGKGLAGVDFRALLSQMGKSISVSTLQGGLIEAPTRPLFGQDEWVVLDDGWNGRDAH